MHHIVIVAGSSRVDSQTAKVAGFIRNRLIRAHDLEADAVSIIDLGRSPLTAMAGGRKWPLGRIRGTPQSGRRRHHPRPGVAWHGVPGDQELLPLCKQGAIGTQAGHAGQHFCRGWRRLSDQRIARLQLQELPPLLHPRASQSCAMLTTS